MDEEKETNQEEGERAAGGFFVSFARNLHDKTSWKIGVSLLVLLILFISFTLTRAEKEKKKTPQSEVSEKREIYKARDIKKTIESKRKSFQNAKSARRSRTVLPRSYDSDIHVFIFEEKEMRENTTRERTEVKVLGLSSGTTLPAYTLGTIFSFNVKAPVIAKIMKDITRDEQIVIPKNSRFLGFASVLKSLNRINVKFDTLIFPDGEELKVKAIALSEDGSSGIKGKLQKHRDLRVLKAIGEGVLAGVSLFAGGVSSDPYSFEDELRGNVTQGLTREARQELRSVKVRESIVVDSFTPIQVMLLDGI